MAAINELKQKTGADPYPHKFHVSRTIPAYRSEYEHIENGGKLENVIESVAGRIYSIRNANKMVFIDLRGDGIKLQVKVYETSFATPDEYKLFVNTLRRGDIIGVEGTPSRTKRGELSIDAKKVRSSQPCFGVTKNIHLIPTEKFYSNTSELMKTTHFFFHRQHCLHHVCM